MQWNFLSNIPTCNIVFMYNLLRNIFVLSGSMARIPFISTKKIVLYCSRCHSSWCCFFFVLPSQRFWRSSGQKIRPLVPIKLLPWHHYLDCDNKIVGRRKCVRCLCPRICGSNGRTTMLDWMHGRMKEKTHRKYIRFYGVRLWREGCVTETNAVLFSYQRLRSKYIWLQRFIVSLWQLSNFVHQKATEENK